MKRLMYMMWICNLRFVCGTEEHRPQGSAQREKTHTNV